MTARRLADGGLIDRTRVLELRFDGRRYSGFAGDTVASALLASGVDVVARSFKYHRPRGIFSIGSEEPNALLQVGSDDEARPNTRATMLPLRPGLVTRSQNAWPNAAFDLLAVNGLFGSLLGAGFYYKTFMWPQGRWMFWERWIRKMAGLGIAPSAFDEARYEHRHAHCDVLVVGAGPAGLRAARAAAESGADVWLVDESLRAGGWLNREKAFVGDEIGAAWAAREAQALRDRENVTLKLGTTAFGYYDHDFVALAEHAANDPGRDRTLWKLRARQVVIATGAIERPQVFAHNDLPGIMLAGAARGYVHEFGVLPGSRVVVATNNDSGWRTALDLHDAGAEVAAVVDSRGEADEAVAGPARERGIPVLMGHAVVAAAGRRRVRGAIVSELAAAAGSRLLDCDLLAISGGWSPAVHLHSHSGGTLRYDEALAAMVPADAAQSTLTAGAAHGSFELQRCLADGERAGAEAATRAGFGVANGAALVGRLAGDGGAVAPLRERFPRGKRKAFVDLQNDVTVADVEQACREGYRSVEHLKRYTTLGMGTDQGKTSNLNGLAILAGRRGESIPAVGITTFRPPYTPVSLGAVAGPDIRARLSRVRRTPIHALHVELGATFDPNGLWLRPKCYRKDGETEEQAITREALAVRRACGVVDISTLGKFLVEGPDSRVFLERIYANTVATLRPGRSRYGLMLREDGMIFDDGTITCLDEQQFFLTASTSHAEHVEEHLSYHHEVCWPGLEVAVTCMTEAVGAVAVAGPEAPAVLEKAGVRASMPPGSLPALSASQGEWQGVPLWLLRISYSGEWACEIHAPARRIADLCRAIVDAGAVPYGLEAMDVLRIEEGYIAVGSEANGRTTPLDLGLGNMAKKETRFIGREGLVRLRRHGQDRLELVGLTARDRAEPLRAGSQLLDTAGRRGFGSSIGHVTSAAYSPHLGRYVALALLANGASRHGDVVYAADPFRGRTRDAAVEVGPPSFRRHARSSAA